MASEGNSATTPTLSDKPVPSKDATIGYGSDVIAEQLSRLNVKYMALVPGSSYRGLHDSVVNLKGNAAPEMLVCLHEEHAVAIAHGYGKVMGKPMAVGLHANVGLMHASMAIFNAFTDRVPVLMLGATGPLDATKRRPWIDWLHTATDQASIIRDFSKWDDQPNSANAAASSLVHAYVSAATKPCGPTYVVCDLGMQEATVDPETIHFPNAERVTASIRTPGPSSRDVTELITALGEAKRPLFLLGRMNSSKSSWDDRLTLAEGLGARVVTDLKQISAFPTDHELHAAAPSIFFTPQMQQLVRDADLILSFDWIDLSGALKASYGPGAEISAKVVHISLDSALHNGWSKDHFDLRPADINIQADPDETISSLAEAMKGRYTPSEWARSDEPSTGASTNGTADDDIYMTDLARAIYEAVPPESMCLVRVPLGFKGIDLRATHPLSFMGMDGGAGIGSGCGQLVGTSLALKELGSSLLPVAVIGDGDFCMGSSALWTAARFRLPLLAIIANNASYYNDEVHQERVAKHRGRPVENKWIGMRLDDPAPDIHKMAEGLGCTVVRPEQVQKVSELGEAMRKAVVELKAGKQVVLDVRVRPGGYSSALEKAK